MLMFYLHAGRTDCSVHGCTLWPLLHLWRSSQIWSRSRHLLGREWDRASTSQLRITSSLWDQIINQRCFPSGWLYNCLSGFSHVRFHALHAYFSQLDDLEQVFGKEPFDPMVVWFSHLWRHTWFLNGTHLRQSTVVWWFLLHVLQIDGSGASLMSYSGCPARTYHVGKLWLSSC